MKKLLLISAISFLIFTSKSMSQEAYLKEGYAVALSEAYFKEMVNATSSGDEAYFKKLISDFKIVVLPKDTKVSVISSSAFKGTVVARIFGKETKVWTVYGALKYE